MHPAATPAPGLWRAVHAARPRGPLTRSIVRRVTVACAAFAATPSPPRRRPPARDRFVPCDSRRVIGGVVGRPSGRPAVRRRRTAGPPARLAHGTRGGLRQRPRALLMPWRAAVGAPRRRQLLMAMATATLPRLPGAGAGRGEAGWKLARSGYRLASNKHRVLRNQSPPQETYSCALA